MTHHDTGFSYRFLHFSSRATAVTDDFLHSFKVGVHILCCSLKVQVIVKYAGCRSDDDGNLRKEEKEGESVTICVAVNISSIKN